MLSNPLQRGVWGEHTLKNIVQAAGMLPHCDFDTQIKLPNGTRPDLIIHLAGERFLAVDSKVPMDAYATAHQTRDPDKHKTALKQHVDALRAHIKTLGKKNYPEKLTASHPTPAFVILFMPHEAGYITALQTDKDLFNDAIEQHGVLLACPTTLMALLKTAACAWRESDLADSAREALAQAGKIHEALHTFLTHFSNLGKAIDKTREKHNETVNSLQKRLLPRAHKLQQQLAQPPHPPIETLTTPTTPTQPPLLKNPPPTNLTPTHQKHPPTYQKNPPIY